jgi:hypothetical protein
VAESDRPTAKGKAVTETTITNDLRTQISDIESKRLILGAQRDEIAYDALVLRNKKAIERAGAIGAELDQLAHQEALLNAALVTARRREAEEKASEAASRKRADLEQAEALLPRVAELAAQMDNAMKTLREASAAFEAHWSDIKRLSGAGPVGGAIKVHLDRAYRTALRGLPGLALEMVPPTERHSVSELAAGWSKQVSNVAAAQIKPAGETPVIRKSKSAAKAA